jgi:hypothetical protein
MAEEPESPTLHLLREIQFEMQEGFEKLRDSVSELQVTVAAIRSDQRRTNELLEQIQKAKRA